MEDMLNLENAQPFTDNEEYLDVLFILETLRLTYSFEKDEADKGRKGRNLNKFIPDKDEIEHLLDSKLESHFDETNLAEMITWDQYVDKRAEATQKEGRVLKFYSMLDNLGMTKFGRSVVVLSLMAALDRDYRRIVQYMSGDVDRQYPSLAFCAKIYFTNIDVGIGGVFMSSNRDLAALKIIFPELYESEDIYNESLIPSGQLLNLIYGINEEYQPYLKRINITDRVEPLIHRTDEFESLCKICGDNKKYDLLKWVILYGDKGAGKKHLICQLANKKRRNLIQIDLRYFSQEQENRETKVKKAVSGCITEMVMTGGLLGILGMETFTEQSSKRLMDFVKNSVKSYSGMVFFIFDKEEYSNPWEDTLTIGLELQDSYKLHDIWEHYAKEYQIDNNVDLWALSDSFSFTPGQIVGALRAACIASMTSDGIIHYQDLVRACYSQIQHRLREKAKRVNACFQWKDLKLPTEEKQVLRELCNRIKNKHIVMSEWNFLQKLPYGSGTPVVFAGPPGTGKTMAAQVIANELSMELYQIDLSQLVDKYIGETEKNIKLVFEQARKSNSILFFDEADSVFAKRVDAKSSNDRYANIESSMLLQSVEAYNGISILATNNLNGMDTAFIRRFKYLVNFRAPDAFLRKEIWESVFPKAAPIGSEVDFKWLSNQFELTGAFIKNIALSAAFLAAEDGSEINMLHILKALKRELIKEGRKLEQTELGDFGYMFSEI